MRDIGDRDTLDFLLGHGQCQRIHGWFDNDVVTLTCDAKKEFVFDFLGAIDAISGDDSPGVGIPEEINEIISFFDVPNQKPLSSRSITQH